MSWRGTRLRVQTAGAGAPLLALHGAGGAAASFAELAPLLPDRRLVVPDLPGHGGSPQLPEGSSPAGVADLLAALCADEGIDETDVFGDGTGGTVTLRLAARRPSLVRRCIVAAASPAARSVHCPVLVLWGARDRRLPDGFELARRLGAPLRAIAGCRSIAERPDVCADAIHDFLG